MLTHGCGEEKSGTGEPASPRSSLQTSHCWAGAAGTRGLPPGRPVPRHRATPTSAVLTTLEGQWPFKKGPLFIRIYFQ